MSYEGATFPGSDNRPVTMTAGDVLGLFRSHHAAWSGSAQFREGIAAIGRAIAEGAGQAAVVLAEGAGWKTALLGLASRSAIPLHDHPNTRGLLYVEAGSVNVGHYDMLARPRAGRAVILADRGSSLLEAGDHDWFGKRRHNLHSLEAGGTGALIFSVRQTLDEPADALLYACLDVPGGTAPGTRLAVAVPPGGRRKIAELD